MDIGTPDSASSILQTIDQWQAKVVTGYREQQVCTRCNGSQLKRHELRRRELRVLVGHTVHVNKLILARWRCQTCNRVFTDYPDFRTPL